MADIPKTPKTPNKCRQLSRAHQAKKVAFSPADLDPQTLEDCAPDWDEDDFGLSAPSKGKKNGAATSGTVRVGKYKGISFKEVHKLDPDYCEWVKRTAQDGALNDFAEWLSTVPAPKRVYIKVPFQRKDFAKQLGARWDGEKKMWYAPEGAREQLIEAFGPAVSDA